MVQCFYCQYMDGHHAAQCPRNDKEAMKLWRKGYLEGWRSLTDIPSSDDPVFGMGF